MKKEQRTAAKRLMSLFWSSIIVLLLISLQSCCKGAGLEQSKVAWYEYSKYDLSCDGVIYVGVSQNCIENKQQQEFIVYEVPQIKEYYIQHGIESLLSEFSKWYYSPAKKEDLNWISQDLVPWNPNTERYVIYLAIINGYRVTQDCESGYLEFDQ